MLRCGFHLHRKFLSYLVTLLPILLNFMLTLFSGLKKKKAPF